MKNSKNKLLFAFLALLLLFSNFSFNSLTVLASDADDQAAIDGAPAGLNISKYFSIQQPTILESDDPYTTNSAATYKNGTVLSLAHGAKNYGAAWSDLSSNNYIDISQDQTISAWLYFGNGEDSSAKNGQGMALVLQNDARGDKALGAGLQGLGVYGYDKATTKGTILGGQSSPKLSDTDYIANTAVQNSMDLEFDTQLNNAIATNPEAPTLLNSPGYLGTYLYTLNGYDTSDTAGKLTIPSVYPSGSRFGFGGAYGHIAMSYPGLPGTYGLVNSNSAGYFSQAFTNIHAGGTTANLVNGTDNNKQPIYWHHLTFTWHKAENGNLPYIEYSFNDKYLDGTINTGGNSDYKLINNKITVDPSVFGDIKDNKLYWGFTGSNSTDANVYSKLVVFESIPALADIDITTTITDTDLGKVITDASTDNTVAHGDKLDINYNLAYDTEISRTNWNNIIANITLPSHVLYTPDSNGNVATVTFHNGTSDKVVQIPSTAITGTNLKYALTEALGKYSGASYTSADVTIHGVADNTTGADIKVNQAPATFSGDEQISSTSTPVFQIKYKKPWTLTLAEQNPIDLLYKHAGQTLDLPTSLAYDLNHTFADTDPIRYEITVDGKTYTTSTQAGTSTSTATGTIPLKDIIDDEDTSADKSDFWNIFTENSTKNVYVKAIDQDGITSNTVTYTVNTIADQSLSIDASNSLEFQDVNYLNTSEYLKRKAAYNVSVTSRGTPWTLGLSSTDLKSDGTTFDGYLVYKEADGTIINIDSDAEVINQQTTSNDELTTKNISADWTNDTGLLLKQTGQSKVGHYSGTLTWSIINSI